MFGNKRQEKTILNIILNTAPRFFLIHSLLKCFFDFTVEIYWHNIKSNNIAIEGID